MKMWSALLISMFMMAPMMEANARNYPCSKSMGGVSHCKDGKSKPIDALPNDKSHVLTKPAKSKSEAISKAKASANKKARQVASFDLTLAVARPDIIADSPATVRGFRPYIDEHQWTVVEVNHDLSGSGYSTGIKCETTIK